MKMANPSRQSNKN